LNNSSLPLKREFDFLSKQEIHNRQAVALFKVFQRCKDHPLVSERLNALNSAVKITPSNILEHWENIKTIDSVGHQNYLKNEDLPPEIYFSDHLSSITISSGGSRDIPKVTLLSFDEISRNSEFHGKGYSLAGITYTDRVATFGLPGILSSEFTVYLALKETGCRIYPIGEMSNPECLVTWIRKLNANVLLVMPSDLFPIIEYLQSTKQRLDGIRLIVTGGEALSESQKRLTQQYIGNEFTLYRSTFQTSDCGTIGYQCEHCSDSEYHVHEELQYIELIKESSGKSILVTTNLDRTLMPLIRVKTGDYAEEVIEPCACGRNSRRIRLNGRVEKELKIGGEKFLTEILTLIPEYFNLTASDIAIRIIKTDSGKDQILIRLRESLLASNSLQDKISSHVLGRALKLKQQMQEKVVAPIEFTSLHANHIFKAETGKMLVFRDLR